MRYSSQNTPTRAMMKFQITYISSENPISPLNYIIYLWCFQRDTKYHLNIETPELNSDGNKVQIKILKLIEIHFGQYVKIIPISFDNNDA